MIESNNIIYKHKVLLPEELKHKIPLSGSIIEIKRKRDKEISDIIRGKSNKKLLIVGPCSADNPKAVMDYVDMLVPIQENVKSKILIIPRVYTEKPRTISHEYMGLIHQPDINLPPDFVSGIEKVRLLHLNIIKRTEFCCADEMLYPETYDYISDLISYITIGARSVENQEHRLLASGLDIPVGMKNPLSGDLNMLLNSIKSAQNKQVFLHRNWEVESLGNDMVHAILRGSIDNTGKNHSNYNYKKLIKLKDLYFNNQYYNPSVIVDTNHSNSNKNYINQIKVVRSVLRSISIDSELKRMFKGFMIESYIMDGKQNYNENTYGMSITDSCLGIEKTEKLIYEIYESL